MNEFVREYLADRGFYETLKECPRTEDAEGNLKQFKKFKKNKMKNQKMRETPKLSFEISFDEDSMRPSVVEVKSRTKREKKKKEIPKDFIAHIVKLGFDAKDAGRLYESKDDWLGMSIGGRILCTERGCSFSVPLSSDALFDHCRTEHDWRDYPCTHDNCRYVAYSPTSFKSHISKFHSPYRRHNGNYHSCPRPGCKAAFPDNSKLSQHEKIHDNDVFSCVFCPYGNAWKDHLFTHQRKHFNARNYACDTCQKTFLSQTNLNEHVRLVHEIDETMTKCPLCDKVDIKHKIRSHLRIHKAASVEWNDKRKQYTVHQMNELMREYLADCGFNETLRKCPGEKNADRRLKKFKKFKKSSIRNQKLRETPKLSFEINLDEDDEQKRIVTSAKEKKKKETKPIKEIPKDFIAHIVKLGFDAKDAARMYECKDDWLGMSSGGKILCAERGCKFSVPLSSNALFEHCRTVHGWRDYPCTHDNCNYVAYSPYSFKSHMSTFHSPYKKYHGNYYSCSWSGCKAAFPDNWKLHQHEKVHNNDVFNCLFCPYGQAHLATFVRHQRTHFGSRDYVCHVCHKAFYNTSHLNIHLKVHDRNYETITECPLCDKVGDKAKIERHLRNKHAVLGIKWDEKHKQFIVPKQVKKNKNIKECL